LDHSNAWSDRSTVLNVIAAALTNRHIDRHLDHRNVILILIVVRTYPRVCPRHTMSRQSRGLRGEKPRIIYSSSSNLIITNLVIIKYAAAAAAIIILSFYSEHVTLTYGATGVCTKKNTKIKQ